MVFSIISTILYNLYNLYNLNHFRIIPNPSTIPYILTVYTVARMVRTAYTI
jgi:hypothetical protein